MIVSKHPPRVPIFLVSVNEMEKQWKEELQYACVLSKLTYIFLYILIFWLKIKFNCKV